MLKRQFLKQYPLLYLFSIPLLHTIYDYLNKNHTDATNILTTADHYIPFIPQFIVPYIGFAFFYVFLLDLLLSKKIESYITRVY
ncbi:hypothetical protein KHA80_14080 [Anaerobacillus sp. HL2]|nr:hypothetical protein KHA80_14080 [Anaerobacillus sp. HL2]